mgnify:CR=1 FL=1|tara:strand:- start:15490 stop:15786 length:297 start_codon:yes stop_codon:yes gene_type:complete
MMLLAPDWLNNAGRCRRCHFSLDGAATVGVCGWGQVCSACVEDMRANAALLSQPTDDLVGDLLALEVEQIDSAQAYNAKNAGQDAKSDKPVALSDEVI